MKYQKPEVVPTACAVEAIQSHTTKGQIQPFDGRKLTDPAYEADE
jgi:hypothetical protein